MAGSYDEMPPMRAEPRTPDDLDPKRIEFVRGCWSAQDQPLRPVAKQMEEHIRMLAGQQWCEWWQAGQEWIDVTQFQSPDESDERWPVINMLLPWFLLTHARLTESRPILAFEPGPDAVDAETAEVLEQCFKTLWRELGMEGTWDEAAAWLAACGRVYLQTRIDPTGGELQPWVGYAELPQLGPDGEPLVDSTGEPITVPMNGVPFDKDGNPLMDLTPDGPVTLGEPHAEPEGCLVVDVLSPLEVRGEWGPTPWHMKAWHAQRLYLPEDEVARRWGVQVKGTVLTDGQDAGMPYLKRLLFSAGHFGSVEARDRWGSLFTDAPSTAGVRWVEVTIKWHRAEKEGTPGRLMAVTPDTVLYDGPAPAALKYTSPIRAFDLTRLPGRVQGTTPLEMMIPIQRSLNRLWKQILEHGDLCTNPVFLVDRGSGIGQQKIGMRPGEGYEVSMVPGVDPIRWVQPPQLSGDVYKTLQLLTGTLEKMGSMQGAEGEAPTDDASGELVKELRFNSDRPLSPAMRRAAVEMGRLAEDWRALLPIIWDRDRVLSYAGEDNVVRVLTVEPHLWTEGKVNVVADVESMLPEGRGERQAQVHQMWQEGMFGDPMSPEARKMYLSLARFPHLGRAVRPGGPDRITAERNLGKILLGAKAGEMPWFPWYDEAVHLDVLSAFMKSPEFLEKPRPIQAELARYWQTLFVMGQQKALAMAAHAAQTQMPTAPPMPGPGAPGGSAPTSSSNGSSPTPPARTRAVPAGH